MAVNNVFGSLVPSRGGIAEALGMKPNPFLNFVGDNRSALLGLAAGIAGGSNWGEGLSQGFANAAQGGQMDREKAEKLKADAKVAQQTNATRDWLAQHHPDLAQAVDAGLPVSQAWQEAFNRQNAANAGPDLTANMRDWQFAQENPGYAEFLNPPSSANQPSSVQEYEYAKAQGFEGSLIDYERQKKAAGRAPMNPTTQKELFEAEDAAKAGDYVLSALDEAISLNDKAYDGPTADIRGDTTALWGDEAGVATARMKNVTTELALSQLKTIFGSTPTEGERKILLELQGSVNQAKPVRAAILKRARAMAERRIADNKAKADALRSGAYFEEGYGAASPGTDVDAILQQYGVP